MTELLQFTPGSDVVQFSAGEIALITGLLMALTGAISAIWFAYNRSMQTHIEGLTRECNALRGIAFEALGLLGQVAREQMTAEQQHALAALHARLTAHTGDA